MSLADSCAPPTYKRRWLCSKLNIWFPVICAQNDKSEILYTRTEQVLVGSVLRLLGGIKKATGRSVKGTPDNAEPAKR